MLKGTKRPKNYFKLKIEKKKVLMDFLLGQNEKKRRRNF
jgi:hypothetical protein